MSGFLWGELLAVLLWSVAAVVVVLGTTFLVALRVGRHAVVDVAWGLGFTAIAVAAFVAGHGDPARSWLTLVLTAAWGLRLATHILLRSRGAGEDPRYAAMLATATGSPTVFVLRRVYLTQGVVMLFVSLPVQVAMVQRTGLGWLTWVGVIVWGVGFAFETVGDLQLQRFRDDVSNRGKVLDTGLWRYTRHPNYFGDATAWWGLFVVAASAWPGILFVLSPLAMTANLMKGTGAKLLEKDIGDRRPEYVEYVKRTSGFFPLPPQKGSLP